MKKKDLHFASTLLAVLLAGAALWSVRPESTASAQEGSGPSKASPARPSGAEASTKVAKIVFIGKEIACQCTRDRVAGSWSALQKALGGRRDIRVERVQADRQRAEFDRYTAMRSIVTLPAVFFLDGAGALVEMLQGEISTEQFQRALRPRRRTPAATPRSR
jgi:hypothetical protein